MKWLSFSILSVFSVAFSCNIPSDLINPNLVNIMVKKIVDISHQFVKIDYYIELENRGLEPITYFFYILESGFERNLSFIEARQLPYKMKSNVSNVKFVNDQRECLVRVEFDEDLLSEQITAIELETIYTQVMEFYPARIKQTQTQLVLYKGNLHFYSPYTIFKEITDVIHKAMHIESYTRIEPMNVSPMRIQYGPFENVPAFSFRRITVHFQSSSIFFVVTQLVRTIEVSHWGYISVEETIDLEHKGAIVEGEIRTPVTQESRAPGGFSFKTTLPSLATDIYYRDDIGNISTSHVNVYNEAVILHVVLRYPLFGGWRIRYTIGYNVPSYKYLYEHLDYYALSMPFIDDIFYGMIIEQVTLKVILLEGSQDPIFYPPFPTELLTHSHHYSSIDTVGRPLITAKATNLVEKHIQDFILYFRCHPSTALLKPLTLSLAFACLFLLIIASVRLDFSFTRNETKELRARVSYCIESILKLHYKRVEMYEEYDSEIVRFKSKQNTQMIVSAIKNINEAHKMTTEKINMFVAKLKTDAPDLCDKVVEMQKLDKNLKEVYFHIQALHLSVANDKGPYTKTKRQKFLDAAEKLNKQRDDCVEKINFIEKSLRNVYF